jgi:hypothetical protein
MHSISRKTKGAREARKETLTFGLNANPIAYIFK